MRPAERTVRRADRRRGSQLERSEADHRVQRQGPDLGQASYGIVR